jgi:hypothetical protein
VEFCAGSCEFLEFSALRMHSPKKTRGCLLFGDRLSAATHAVEFKAIRPRQQPFCLRLARRTPAPARQVTGGCWCLCEFLLDNCRMPFHKTKQGTQNQAKHTELTAELRHRSTPGFISQLIHSQQATKAGLRCTGGSVCAREGRGGRGGGSFLIKLTRFAC